MTAASNLTNRNPLHRAWAPIDLRHMLAALAGWFVIAALCRIALPQSGATGREFVAFLSAATLLFSASGGVRGWLAALGAVLTVAGLAVAGILFARWAGVRLEVDNEGLRNLIHIPAAAPSIALAVGLVRMLNCRFGARQEPGQDADGEEAMTTGEAAVGCTATLAYAGLSVMLFSFVSDLFGQIRHTLLALAGFDLGPVETNSIEGTLIIICTAFWLVAHWRNRAARYVIFAVQLVFLSLSIWIPVFEPWLAERLAPDADTILNGLVRAVPSILVMGLWLVALLAVGWKYGLFTATDETEETPRNQEAGA